MQKSGLFFLTIAMSFLEATILNEFPSLAMNGDGNAIVLWQGYDSLQKSIVVRTASLPWGGSWSSPETLSPPGKTAMYPKAAIDPTGQMIGVWEAAIETAFSIQAAAGQFGSGWNDAATLSETTHDNTCPEIDMDARGNGLILWQKKSTNTYLVRTSSYLSSSDMWSAPAALNIPSRTMPFPEAVVNGTGKALALWQQFNNTGHVIQASMRNPGEEWTSPETLSNPSCNSTSVQGAINDSGLAIALWQQGNATGLTIEAAICSPEGVWGEPTALSTAGTISTNPIVAMNGSGKIVVIWQNSTSADASAQAIQAVIYSNGAWSAPATLSDPSLQGAHPFLAMNSSGQAVAVWAVNGVIQASILSAENVWSAASRLSDPASNSFYPQCGIDSSGNGAAVWQTAVGSDKEIQASVYISGGSWTAKTVVSD